MPVKILVVDDEPQFERLILQRFRKKIRAEEFEFIFAYNGLEALEKLAQLPQVDIVLTDINMPQMDGLTFLSKLHETEISVKAVVISAYGDLGKIRVAMNRGAYDFVTKPVDFEDLDITINKALKEIEIFRLAEKARRELDQIQNELSVASQIQQSILPQDFSVFPASSSYELYAKMIPAKEVGGDFYDFFYIDEEHFGMVIGDVSGKGMPAALFMAISRTLIKAIGVKSKSVSQCLEEVNFLLCQDNQANMFVTLFYGVLNLSTGVLEYSSGGHNPPWVVHPDKKAQYLDDSQNVPLSIVDDFNYHSKKITIEPGSSLVLYTDGVTEALNKDGQFYSEERLESYLNNSSEASPKNLVNGIINEVETFAKGTAQSDDITVMVIQRKV